MPDIISDVGSSDGGSGVVLNGYISSSDVDAGIQDGEIYDDGEAPLFTIGDTRTQLVGGVIQQQQQPFTTGAQQFQSGADQQGGGKPAIQAVKLDIRNTVVLPLEPCRTASYLKLVFLPVDPEFKLKREHRRETSIPFPEKTQLLLSEFKSKFDGKVHTGDPRYIIRWQQVLPVIVTPQDSESVDYKTTDVYDFRTAVLLNDDSVLQWLDMSELPITQISKAEDIQGGTLDIDSLELYLDDVIFAHLDESTGRLLPKDPVEAGIFTDY